MQNAIFLLCTANFVLLAFVLGGKLFPKKTEFISFSLNNYQVQVYDYKHDMIHTGIYEGFSAEDAIRLCRNELRRKGKIPTVKPIRFFTTNK